MHAPLHCNDSFLAGPQGLFFLPLQGWVRAIGLCAPIGRPGPPSWPMGGQGVGGRVRESGGQALPHSPVALPRHWSGQQCSTLSAYITMVRHQPFLFHSIIKGTVWLILGNVIEGLQGRGAGGKCQ